MSKVIIFFEGDNKLGQHPLNDEQAAAMAPLLAAVQTDPSLRSLFTNMLSQQLSAVAGADPANPLLAALRSGSAELRMEISEAEVQDADEDVADAGDLADAAELGNHPSSDDDSGEADDSNEDDDSSSEDSSSETSSDDSSDSAEIRQAAAEMIGEGGPV